MVNGRAALRGDAAFATRPHTAMGVAKAAGDALTLRRRLAGDNDIESALIAYEQGRELVGVQISAYSLQLGTALE
jgi:2-polyprenyl-6-methoxyphenol hydroxylase-like FAD-dependent oxidoreductase